MTDQSTPSGVIYRRLVNYVIPYWRLFVIAILAMIALAATAPSFAALFKPLVDGSFIEKDPAVIRAMPFVMMGLFILRGLAGFVSAYCMHWIGRQVIKTLRSQMFSQLLALPARFYDTTSSGRLLSRITYDTEQVANAGTTSVTILIRDSLEIIGLLAWMFYISPSLSLVFVIVGPMIGAAIAYVSKRFRKLSSNIQESMGGVTHIAQEAIDAHKVVKIFGGQQHETENFETVNEYNRRQNLKMAITNAISMPVIQLIGASGLAIIVYLATLDAMLSTFTPGTFMSFVVAMVMLLPPIKRLTSINSGIQKGIAAGSSIFWFLDQDKERDTGTAHMQRARGEIEYRNVSFFYNHAHGQVLTDINIHVEAGQTVAFVGQSGSGKTTLVSLLPRFYDLEQGEILIDGMNINSLTLQDLRNQISLVSQDVTLFNDTVANNIAYGSLHTTGRQEIIKAATVAHAMEFIDSMQDGLDTMVGEDGVMLSGGQRQRIAIARALLKDAPILVLDEATSSLDTESERYIQEALVELMNNRTTLVIAHRLSTIEKADKIIVMSDGRIAETGTHAELLAKGGFYTSLYNMQFSSTSN